MRALQLTDGFGLEHLKLIDAPTPTPGPYEVLVRMRAVSLNFRDLLMMNGLYGGGLSLPITPFSDGCGIPDDCRADIGARLAGPGGRRRAGDLP